MRYFFIILGTIILTSCGHDQIHHPPVVTNLHSISKDSLVFSMKNNESFNDIQEWLENDHSKYKAIIHLNDRDKHLLKRYTALLKKHAILNQIRKTNTESRIELFAENLSFNSCDKSISGCTTNKNLINMVKDKSQFCTGNH